MNDKWSAGTVGLLWALLLASAPAVAQYGMSQGQYMELTPVERAEADAYMRMSAEKAAKHHAQMKALREKLLRMKPLPPEQNVLMGKWSVVKRARKKDALTDAFDTIVNLDRAKCEGLFGDGVTEFKPKSWSKIDGYGDDSLGPVEYRGGGKRVWVIPAKTGALNLYFLAFDFADANRVNALFPAVIDDCPLIRAGAPTQAAQAAQGAQLGGANRPPAPSSAAGAPPSQMANAAPAPPSTTPGRPSQEVCSVTFLDKLGVATFSPVRKALDMYYKETLQGTVPNSQLTRLDARGSGCDDPRIQATLYDFDANGVLQSITFAWARPAGPGPAPIFNERVKTLSIVHSLPPPQSPGRLQADTSLGRLILEDLPERNLLLEAYKAKK